MTVVLWSLALLYPLVLSAALAVSGLAAPERAARTRRRLIRCAPPAVVPFVLLTLLPQDGPAGRPALEVPWMLFGVSWELDPVARPLVLTGALLYGAALAATTWLRPAPAEGIGSAGLTGFLLVSLVGNLGVVAAADAVSFYLCFALMSFAAYGLVVHHRTREARRAGRVYLVLTVLSESAILGALLLVVSAGGMRLADAPAAAAGSEHLHWIVGLLLVGFGVKAGALPLHVWLPLAHPAAPPAASAVLSGAMVKAGLVGWLRFLPLGEVALERWGTALVLLALLGAFLAVPAGDLQADPKVVLAYSTISQMGFLAALVGVALAVPELAEACIGAAVVYSVHHGLAKGALFLGVPVWKHFGADRTAPLAVLGLCGAALAVAGAPFSSGAVGKYAAKNAVEGVTVAGLDLTQLLPLVATGSTLLLLRFGLLLVRSERGPRHRPDAELWAWLLIVLTGITLPWTLTRQWVPIAAYPGIEPVTLWGASWPILLGLAIGAAWWRLSARDGVPAWAAHPDGRTVPPGDLLVPEERVLRRIGRSAVRAEQGAARTRAAVRAAAGRLRPGPRRIAAVGSAVRAVHSWSGSGVALLLLVTGTAVALAVVP
jgi:formate hydrogenlyase subunit 3/multisubunit Na+/H+ antiporter MnhD subunit